ncbi:MAG: hypothetical protein ACYCO3_01940 [Mycobacteriales bacterium]
MSDLGRCIPGVELGGHVLRAGDVAVVASAVVGVGTGERRRAGCAALF